MTTNALKEDSLQSLLLANLGVEKRLHYDLKDFKKTLGSLGNPGHTVHTLTITGTNGKGTTSLFLSSVLKEAGFRVATYLSPHLQSPSERLLMNLEPIDEKAFGDLILEFLPVAKRDGLSYFEFLTLLNFVRAERERPDFLVLEVGLGGRLDATNVADPLGCVITNIDLDHQEYLGDTKEKILEEKLGILNAEGLLFTGIRDGELLRLVEKRCEELDSIYYYTKELTTSVESATWGGQRIRINNYPFELNNPSAGTVENAATAFLTSRILFPRISIATMQRAFAQIHTPGRFEIVQESPRVILSGDHNPAGVASLLATLDKIGAREGGKLHVLCAFSSDKPFRTMYERLKSISDTILVTRINDSQKTLPEGYASVGPYEPNPHHALDEMMNRLKTDDTLIVTGSLYLVGELRSRWSEKVNFLSASTEPTNEIASLRSQ
jgi:dihydrofolate synthase / folylpolyglutamate synthase